MERRKNYTLMSDEQILADLAAGIDGTRRTKRLKDSEVAAAGGTSRRALSAFRNGGSNISLLTFIKLMRGIGELEQLETLLSSDQQYSPVGKPERIPQKRVRDRRTDTAADSSFSWGDEQ